MDDFLLNTVGMWAINLMSGHPVVGGLLMIVGVLRVSLKPAMTIAQAVVKATPYDSDDKWLADTEQSKGFKFLAYVLDWTASIKLPEKPKSDLVK